MGSKEELKWRKIYIYAYMERGKGSQNNNIIIWDFKYTYNFFSVDIWTLCKEKLASTDNTVWTLSQNLKTTK